MKKALESLAKYENYTQIALCVLSLIILFIFPFVNCDYGYDQENTFTGFTMAMNTYIGYFLIVLPAALIGTNFSPKLARKKELLSIAVPFLCIVSWILTVIFSKTFNSQFSDATLSYGAYITVICYILLGVLGIVLHKDTIVALIKEIKSK